MKRVSCVGVSAALALALAATASPQESVTFSGIVSNGLDNGATNGLAAHTFSGSYTVRSISVVGQITEIATADFAGEKIIRVTTPSGQTFVLDPFGAYGGYTGTFVHCGNYRADLPVPETAAGDWTFRFSESLDDGGTSIADATWDTITLTLHDDSANSGATDLGTLAVGSTTTQAISMTGNDFFMYKITIPAIGGTNAMDISLDGPADVDTFLALYDSTGRLVNSDDLEGPANFSSLTFGAGCPTRPNTSAFGLAAGVAHNGRDGVTLAPGEYYVVVSGDSPGNPYTGSPNGTGTNQPVAGYGVYGCHSRAGSMTLSINLVDVSNSTPTTVADLGVLSTPLTQAVDVTLTPGQFQWIRFEVPANVAAGASFLDIVTSATDGVSIIDTEIGLYRADSGLEDSDDNDGPGSFASLSYGDGCPPRPNGDGVALAGNDGTLAAGVYYLAIGGGPTATFGACFGAAGAFTASGGVTVTFTYDVATPPSAPSATDLGEISTANTGLLVDDAALNPGQILWYTFTVPSNIEAAGGLYLDMHTGGSALAASNGSHTRLNDTYIRLFRENGTQVSFDDDDWFGFGSALTYGTGSGEISGDGSPAMNGRDGAATLTAGRYYLAVMAFPSSLLSCGFGAATTHVDVGTVDVTFFTNAAPSGPTCPPCAADYNQDDGVDDLDIAAFFADFENGETCADVNGDDGIDDLDISFFFTAFEQGC